MSEERAWQAHVPRFHHNSWAAGPWRQDGILRRIGNAPGSPVENRRAAQRNKDLVTPIRMSCTKPLAPDQFSEAGRSSKAHLFFVDVFHPCSSVFIRGQK